MKLNGKVRRFFRLHRVHYAAGLAYTGHELLHAQTVALIAILCWVGLCELALLASELFAKEA